METSPFAPQILFHIGVIPISRPVATSWGIMAALTLISWLGLRRAEISPGGLQEALEIVVETLAQQIEDVLRRDPWPYLPLIGTLFLFLLFANLAAVVPGLQPPTGQIETPAALGAIVFFSVHVFGMRARGFEGYLRRYIQPNPLLLPLNLMSDFTRIFSLMVRLFGNMMSHEFIIAIVVFLAGLFLPIPFMLLGVLIGIIQAYIFTVLATVYIGAAVSGGEGG